MSVDIQLPNIKSTDTAGQIAEVKSYLYQMVQQLNWALNAIGAGSTDIVVLPESMSDAASPEETAFNTFNSIKSLIIKSADIISAYEETFNQKFSGEFLARSEFGTYLNDSLLELEISPNAIKQSFEDIQSITNQDGTGKLDEIGSSLIAVHAHIKTGALYTDEGGEPVYGVEVGQRTKKNGKEVFNKFARFTANRLSFYDANGNEVAYISDYKLYITHAQVLGNLTLGKYVIDTTDGIAFRWIGG